MFWINVACAAVWAVHLALFICTDYTPDGLTVGLAMAATVLFFVDRALESR
ncbi:hypothetical protein [Paenibacillus naphthalenovorans]|uniref:hypothetical protein n=1 Tax=Paenibacillus naphthalenovorans TaxID=162209 RepID=UPI003D29DBC5